MKFPLTQEPFPGFDLSPGKRVEIERYADALVRETLDEYTTFVGHQQRVVDRRHWKPVKTRESVTVYKQKIRPEVVVNPEYSMPKLLGVGTILGSLDDVMYGEMAPDVATQRIRSTYLDDEAADARVLSQLRYANEDDPYRFLAIKWLVKAHNPAIGLVMRPRDMVIIDSMGVQTLPSGERLGHHLMHSVELPQCPALTKLDIVRCKVSACFLFKEMPKNRTVEVYLNSLIDAGGHAPDALAVHTAANSLIQCWRTVWCAQLKKLSWFTHEAARQRALDPDLGFRPESGSSSSGPETPAGLNGSSGLNNSSGLSSSGGLTSGGRKKARCACCEKSLSASAFRAPMACALCCRLACAKCRTAKQLSSVSGPQHTIVQHTTVFCVDCVVRAKKVNSSEIARYEYVPGALAHRNFEMLDAGASARRERRLRLAQQVSSSPLSAVHESADERETIVESIEAWEIQLKLDLEDSASSVSSIG